jgi:hypothetical protein
LDLTLFGQFDRGFDPIAGIAGAGAYSDRFHILLLGCGKRIVRFAAAHTAMAPVT